MNIHESLRMKAQALISLAQQNSFLLHWLASISAITFIVSLFLIPWIISRLPEDFFARIRSRQKTENNNSFAYNLIMTLLRNIFGLTFLLAGIIMLFTPGQGILTIILGISIMVFPGKRRLFNLLIEKKSIQHSLNWIRCKADKPEFEGFDQNR